MELFWPTVGLFLIYSGLQTGLIFLQQSGGQLTRWWGYHAFLIYNGITLTPWAAFVLVYVALQFTQHPSLPWENLWLRVNGGILILVGTSLALWVAILMGTARLNGLRFFVPALQRRAGYFRPFSLDEKSNVQRLLPVALGYRSVEGLPLRFDCRPGVSDLTQWNASQGGKPRFEIGFSTWCKLKEFPAWTRFWL